MKKLLLLILFAFAFAHFSFSQNAEKASSDNILQSLQQYQDRLIKRPKWDGKRPDSLLRSLLGLNSNLEARTSAFCRPDTDLIRAFLVRLPFLKDGESRKEDALVLNYSFTKLIKSDFNNLVLGNDKVPKLKRYATLDLSESPAFSFSPLIIEPDKPTESYQNILSLNISGKLNSQKFYDLSKVRDLGLNLSWIRILQWTNYKPKGRSQNVREDSCDLKNQINKFITDYWKKFEEGCDGNCLTDEKREENSKKLREDFYKEYSDFELEMMQDYWDSKNFWWVSIEGELARDRVDFVTAVELQSGNYAKKSEVVFTPSVTVSINYFTQKESNENSFFMNLWGTFKRKHSLSEILEPKNFQPFQEINSSLYQVEDVEEVFVTDFSELDKKSVVDFGIRVIGLADFSWITPNRKKQIGLSFSFSRKGLVNNESFASLFRTELGLVLPFLKPDGKSTLNLELFRRWDTFSNFSNDNNKLWGVRFNVPIN